MKCTNTNKIPTLSGVKIQFDFRGLHKSYKILCGIALAREVFEEREVHGNIRSDELLVF